MILRKGIVVICGGLFLLMPRPSDAQAQQPSDTEVATASEVGAQVQDALKQADSTGLAGMHLQKAVLTLEYGTTEDKSGSISFLIFTISHKSKKTSTETTTLTFSRLPKPHGKGIQALTIPSLKDELAKAIAQAAVAASQINLIPLQEAEFKIDFAVEKTPGAQISFEILGAKVSGGIDLTKTSKNTLDVFFSQ